MVTTSMATGLLLSLLSFFSPAPAEPAAPATPPVATGEAISAAIPVDSEVILLVYSDGGVSFATLDAASGEVVSTPVRAPFVIQGPGGFRSPEFPGVLRSEYVDATGVLREVTTDCDKLSPADCIKAHKVLSEMMLKAFPKKPEK